MKFFGLILLTFALPFAEAKIESAQEGPIYLCDDTDYGDSMEVQITEGMLALVTRFGPNQTFRYSRNTARTETSYAQFISDNRHSPPLNVSKGILESTQTGEVWEAEPGDSAWVCKIKAPEPQPSNRFLKAHEFKEDGDLTDIIRLKNGQIVTVTTASFNLNIWTKDKFGFSKSQILKGPTTYIEKVIELKDGGLASLSPRSGEVRIWTESKNGAYESKTFDIGIDGKRVHSFIELKNRTLVVTNGTELVFLKPKSDGTYQVSRKALPVTGANEVFELSEGRLLVTSVLSLSDEALLLQTKGEDFEISTVKTPSNQNLRMLPSGRMASIIGDGFGVHTIEIWKPEFVVGGDNVERRIVQYYSSFRSLTELESGDIVFFGQDNTLRLWFKDGGLVEFLAKDVASKSSRGRGAQWIPVIPPNKSEQSFLFVDRDTVSMWEEKP